MKAELTIKMLYEDVVVFCDCGRGHQEYRVAIGETFEVNGCVVKLDDIVCNDSDDDRVYLLIGKRRIFLGVQDSLSFKHRYH